MSLHQKGFTWMRLPAHSAPSVAGSTRFQEDLVALVPFLRAFARTLCRHRDLAEDLAQNALIKAWRSRGQFQVGTNLKAWLFTILRNEYYSHRRRAWRETHWDETKGDCIPAAPNSQLWSLELADTAHALHDLPDGQREALILVAAGGFSYEDAARICQTPIGTVKSRVARGRVALLQKLDDRQKHPRCPSVERHGGSHDILAQLDALMPAGTHGIALG